jgi:hypothetical protein
MHGMFFIAGVTEPPQSPVGAAGCAQIISNHYSLIHLSDFTVKKRVIRCFTI